MHKLIILFEQPVDRIIFQQGWQHFLRLAEKMPGLRRETISRIEQMVFSPEGSAYYMAHELIFDSRSALEAAIQSPEGEAAGQWLQRFTNGCVILMIAEHQEAKQDEFGSRGKDYKKRL